MSNYFEINNLKVNFKTMQGIINVININHLSIDKGQILGLVGESGAGKSVLAFTILQILGETQCIIESGEIFFNGKDLLKNNKKEMLNIRGKKIAMIFQDPMSTLNPVLTIGEQLITVIQKNMNLSKKEAINKAKEMIDLVKLPDAKNIMKKYPHELSGGQRQRIIISLALSCGAEFLIADEPTRNLDVTIQAGIIKLLVDLKKKLNVTVLFITNNLALVSITCDQVAVLLKGEIVEMGTTHDIVHNPVHPYTKSLLKALPNTEKQEMDIKRLILDAENISNVGCKYYSKCSDKMPRCQNESPLLEVVNGSHYVACHKKTFGGDNNE